MTFADAEFLHKPFTAAGLVEKVRGRLATHAVTSDPPVPRQ